jgi:hypothetical protein
MPYRSRTIFTLVVCAVTLCCATSSAARVGDCGQPASTGDQPTASDALAVLRAAVGTESCAVCTCDADGSGGVAATDALAVLRRAVGLSVPLLCAACPGAVVPPPTVVRGAASGFVYAPSATLVIDHPSSAPVGATPVADASIRAFDHDGDPLGETTTAADGSFTLADLPTGLVRFEVRNDPQSTVPDEVVEATIVPAVTAALGRSYAIDRAAALAAALDGVVPTALVAGSLNPFPAGTIVYPSGNPTTGAPQNSDVHRFASESWFFFVDPEPLADFTHPAEFVLVDAATGDVVRIAVGFQPVINHGRLWNNRDDLFIFEPENLTHLDPPDYPVGAEAIPTSEVVQPAEVPDDPNPPDDVSEFPAPLGDDTYDSLASIPLEDPDPFVASAHFNNTGTDGVFVVFIRTGSEGHFEQNVSRLASHLLGEGVASANMAKADFTNLTAPNPDTSGQSGESAADLRAAAVRQQVRRAVLHFEPVIRQRLEQEGKHSTLIVYITGHGGGGRMTIDYKEDESGAWGFGPSDLGIEETQACRVRVIVQSCGAENFQNGLAQIFETTEHDAVVFSASAGDKGASATPGWVTYIPLVNILRQGGSHFTTRFARLVTVENGDLASVTTTDTGGKIVLVDDLAELDSSPPAPYVRPSHPSWCFPTGCGDGVVMQPEHCDVGDENSELSCLGGTCENDCTCDNACMDEGECAAEDVCLFQRCALECSQPDGCPAGDTCSFVQNQSGTFVTGCGPENSGGAPVGTPCVEGGECQSWFCESLLAECVAVCSLGEGGNASCPGQYCIEFYFSQGLGLCGTSCAGDADCGAGRVCRLARDSESNLYRPACFGAVEERADAGEACLANAECNSSNCMTPPNVQSSCVNNGDCGQDEYCTPFRRCALPVCTAHCATNDDCPAALPTCVDLDIPTPDGLSTQMLAVCGP